MVQGFVSALGITHTDTVAKVMEVTRSNQSIATVISGASYNEDAGVILHFIHLPIFLKFVITDESGISRAPHLLYWHSLPRQPVEKFSPPGLTI